MGLVLWCGCQPANKFAPPPPPQVTVAVPVKRDVQIYFETTGQTRAVQVVDLMARVGGYLKEIHFKDGQLVKEGDILFVIDQETYLAAVASAKAALKRAEAQLRLAEQQLVRTRELARENATTQSTLDIQQADRDSRDADVDAAKAALREAELNLGYTVITAPFSGRIGRHLVDIGNLVLAGQTMMASLESVDPMHAYFTLSESDLLRFMEMLKAGQIQPITEADPLKLDLALGDSQDFRFHGQLDFRKFGIDRATGTAERRAVFPNSQQDLVPGLFVRIRAAVGEPVPSLLVDEEAIGRDQRGDFLLVVDSTNHVEYRSVKLGPIDQGLQAIEKGIAPTDHVVIRGLQRARPGSEVDPTLVPMESLLQSRTKEAAVGEKAADGKPAETRDRALMPEVSGDSPAAPGPDNKPGISPQEAASTKKPADPAGPDSNDSSADQ